MSLTCCIAYRLLVASRLLSLALTVCDLLDCMQAASGFSTAEPGRWAGSAGSALRWPAAVGAGTRWFWWRGCRGDVCPSLDQVPSGLMLLSGFLLPRPMWQWWRCESSAIMLHAPQAHPRLRISLCNSYRRFSGSLRLTFVTLSFFMTWHTNVWVSSHTALPLILYKTGQAHAVRRTPQDASLQWYKPHW